MADTDTIPDFPHLTDGDLRDLLAALDRQLADGCDRQEAVEELAWSVEVELHRRHMLEAHDLYR